MCFIICLFAFASCDDGEKTDDTTTPEPHVHNYNNISVTEPTCTEKGYTRHICTCGDYYDDAFSRAYGHTDGEWITDKEPTCTETGTKHQICAICGVTINNGTVAATGHKNGEWETEKEATEVEDGIKNQHCSVCDAKLKTEVINATGTLGLEYTTIVGGAYSVSVGECKNVSKIIIPKMHNGLPVTTIQEYAFRYCTNLTSITIPDSVTSIGDVAFDGCTSLTSITIPDSVTSIGTEAFADCESLTSITVDKGNTVYHSSRNCLIETKSKTLILGCKNSVIPTDVSVTSIRAFAFFDCTGLTSITIPDSVTSIGDVAFYGCTSLTSVTFEGTKAQWNSVSKGSYWKTYAPFTVVHCSNGDIAVRFD